MELANQNAEELEALAKQHAKEKEDLASEGGRMSQEISGANSANQGTLETAQVAADEAWARLVVEREERQTAEHKVLSLEEEVEKLAKTHALALDAARADEVRAHYARRASRSELASAFGPGGVAAVAMGELSGKTLEGLALLQVRLEVLERNARGLPMAFSGLYARTLRKVADRAAAHEAELRLQMGAASAAATAAFDLEAAMLRVDAEIEAEMPSTSFAGRTFVIDSSLLASSKRISQRDANVEALAAHLRTLMRTSATGQFVPFSEDTPITLKVSDDGQSVSVVSAVRRAHRPSTYSDDDDTDSAAGSDATANRQERRNKRITHEADAEHSSAMADVSRAANAGLGDLREALEGADQRLEAGDEEASFHWLTVDGVTIESLLGDRHRSVLQVRAISRPDTVTTSACDSVDVGFYFSLSCGSSR
mmetsp:Transcript_37488/g.86648  ORF Transcript_37488/g.86648 Transcript_37488/m.86648 type:complete len:426 (+) Transcript_37488:605-1882(+)